MKIRKFIKKISLRILYLLFIGIVLFSGCLQAQTRGRWEIRSGNREYKRGDYKKAEDHFRKALGRKGPDLQGNFNLGNTLYRKDNFDNAYDQFRLLAGQKHDSIIMSRIYYNLGNAAIKRYLGAGEDKPDRGKYLSEGIDAFSKALRYSPEDEDARHNLTLSLKLRNTSRQQEQKQQEQHQQNQKKQEQPLPEIKLKEEEREQTRPEHEKGKISREDAERMLNAIREKEMSTAEQIHARERKLIERGKLKDW